VSARALQRGHVIPLEEGSTGEGVRRCHLYREEEHGSRVATACEGECGARVGGNRRQLRC
jgi:hypothetical protein